jgi:transcriptional regulator with XRE-family HTH domain
MDRRRPPTDATTDARLMYQATYGRRVELRKQLREDAGVDSQRELARLARLAHPYVSLIESGVRNPSPYELVAITDALFWAIEKRNDA